MRNASLESQILAAYREWIETKQRKHWNELVRLVKQRTPARVREMEREKGLA